MRGRERTRRRATGQAKDREATTHNITPPPPLFLSARTVAVDRSVLESLLLQEARSKLADLSDADLAALVERSVGGGGGGAVGAGAGGARVRSVSVFVSCKAAPCVFVRLERGGGGSRTRASAEKVSPPPQISSLFFSRSPPAPPSRAPSPPASLCARVPPTRRACRTRPRPSAPIRARPPDKKKTPAMAKQASSAKAGLYALLNILSASGIVFANKVGKGGRRGGGWLGGRGRPPAPAQKPGVGAVCPFSLPPAPTAPPSPRSTRYTR